MSLTTTITTNIFNIIINNGNFFYGPFNSFKNDLYINDNIKRPIPYNYNKQYMKNR